MKAMQISPQKGLSLIELLIAMVLSLLLIGGVLQVFLSSKQTYNTNSALSRVQENGRYAMEFISFDIRNSAYKGECVAPMNNLLDTALEPMRFNVDLGLEAWDDSEEEEALPTWFTNGDRLAGTDMLLTKHAVNASGAIASGTTEVTADTINLTAASGVATGTILVASDPIGCDIFQNQSAPTASAVSRPLTGNFSHIYTNTMEILNFQSAIYYIKNGASGLPSLWRTRYDKGTTGEPEELVEGIMNMQLQYALGSDKQIIGDYVDAQDVTDWGSVISARIDLLAISSDINVANANQIITFNGTDVEIPDGRLAKVFTTTIGIRNRLP